MPNEIVVRFATLEDASWCAKTLTVSPERVMGRKIEDQEVIVAERALTLLGVLELQYIWKGHGGGLPYISGITVLDAHRKQGIGRAMLHFVEDDLKKKGYSHLYSSSQLDEWPPQAWHRHMGFEECGILNGVNEEGVGEVFFRKCLVG